MSLAHGLTFPESMVQLRGICLIHLHDLLFCISPEKLKFRFCCQCAASSLEWTVPPQGWLTYRDGNRDGRMVTGGATAPPDPPLRACRPGYQGDYYC